MCKDPARENLPAGEDAAAVLFRERNRIPEDLFRRAVDERGDAGPLLPRVTGDQLISPVAEQPGELPEDRLLDLHA